MDLLNPSPAPTASSPDPTAGSAGAARQRTGRATAEYPEIADQQGQVFTAAQARAGGWTARQVQRRIDTGRWRRVAGRGFSHHPPPEGPEPPWRLAWAAHLTWPDVVIGGHVAAAIHGFPVPHDESVDVYTGRGRASGRRIRVRVASLEPDDILLIEPLLVTSALRTAVDCLGRFPWPDALDLYAWVTTRHIVRRDELFLAARQRLGCHGTPQLLRLLRYTRGGAVSGAEALFHELMRRERIGGWTAGVEVSDADGVIGVVDVLFARARVIVEIDGRRAHSDPHAFVHDRRRQNRLVNAGYRVLRFTWWDLTERPAEVIAQLRKALMSRDHRRA
ncbi:MAG: DUF559 domain-containing protein [Kineosporiaceae bacterium]